MTIPQPSSETELSRWVEFIGDLTVEWLVDNYIEEEKSVGGISRGDLLYVDTYATCFFVHAVESPLGSQCSFRFKTPDGLVMLMDGGDDDLVGGIPPDVWNDFIRLIDL